MLSETPIEQLRSLKDSQILEKMEDLQKFAEIHDFTLTNLKKTVTKWEEKLIIINFESINPLKALVTIFTIAKRKSSQESTRLRKSPPSFNNNAPSPKFSLKFS